MKKQKLKLLLTFIGSNDAGKLLGKPDGAIITVLKNEKFDRVHLLWNRGKTGEITYEQIAEYLKNEISKKKLAKNISSTELPIKDVINHNNIYLVLKEFTDKLDKSKNFIYTAAISSGTPAMSVCWILLAESGEFSETNPLRLIQVTPPEKGKLGNLEVKIDTSLPRIVRLKEEVINLKKDLIPVATISVTRPGLKIGKVEVILSPIELSYYRYFAERVLEGKGDEKFSGVNTSKSFLVRILQIHEELFPDLDTNRKDLIDINKESEGLYIYSFRANVSKTNKRIRDSLLNDSISKTFEISSEGQRGAKFYGIKAPKEKIQIVN